MPLAWQILTATDFEVQQILKAAAGTGPSVAGHYYAGISTTLPTKAGAYTEYSGSGYAAVMIPAWAGAGTFGSSDFTVIDTDYADQFFTVWAATPAADITFPTPTATWWSGGTTVYLILKDAASGGTLRWWAAITPALGPGTTNPLTIPVGNLMIGIARNDALSEAAPATTVSVFAGQTWAKAIDKLTGVDPFYSPAWYVAAGWGQYYDDSGAAMPTYTEPGNPAGVAASWNAFTPGFDYNGGVLTSGSGNTRDASYARQPITWGAPTADADGFYIANATDILWTLGDNTVVSGSPIPPGPVQGDQMDWSATLYKLGIGDVGSPSGGRGGRTGGHAFTLWQLASGGHGGPPPSLVTGAPGDPVSGLIDEQGVSIPPPGFSSDIWAYLYTPSVSTPGVLPTTKVVLYSFVDTAQVINSVSDGAGEFIVHLPFTYNIHQFLVGYQLQGDGSWKDPISGFVYDPSTDLVHYLGWGTTFPPDASHGGLHYYTDHSPTGQPGGGFTVIEQATYSETDMRFGVGDQVKIDTGAIRIRLR